MKVDKIINESILKMLDDIDVQPVMNIVTAEAKKYSDKKHEESPLESAEEIVEKEPFLGAKEQPLPKAPELPKFALDESLFEGVEEDEEDSVIINDTVILDANDELPPACQAAENAPIVGMPYMIVSEQEKESILDSIDDDSEVEDFVSEEDSEEELDESGEAWNFKGQSNQNKQHDVFGDVTGQFWACAMIYHFCIELGWAKVPSGMVSTVLEDWNKNKLRRAYTDTTQKDPSVSSQKLKTWPNWGLLGIIYKDYLEFDEYGEPIPELKYNPKTGTLDPTGKYQKSLKSAKELHAEGKEAVSFTPGPKFMDWWIGKLPNSWVPGPNGDLAHPKQGSVDFTSEHEIKDVIRGEHDSSTRNLISGMTLEQFYNQLDTYYVNLDYTDKRKKGSKLQNGAANVASETPVIEPPKSEFKASTKKRAMPKLNVVAEESFLGDAGKEVVGVIKMPTSKSHKDDVKNKAEAYRAEKRAQVKKAYKEAMSLDESAEITKDNFNGGVFSLLCCNKGWNLDWAMKKLFED